MKKMCLNIGAGNDIRQNDDQTTWINLDKCYEEGIDIVRNVEKQCLPSVDSSIDHIYCGDVLEHLDELIYPMNEMWRVLKPNGTLHINTPYGVEANWRHITHRRIFYPQSWLYFDSQVPNYIHMRKADGIKADFMRKCSDVTEDGDSLWTELIARKELFKDSRLIRTSKACAISNDRAEAIKLDVGCGYNKRNDTFGWIGVDRDPNNEADINCDIEKGLPFPNKSVDFIYTSHTLEYIIDLVALMNEFWRVLKKNGLVEIIAPYYNTVGTRNPEHKRFMHKDLWNFWDPSKFLADRKSCNVKAKFKVVQSDSKILNFVCEQILFITLRKID